MKVRFADVILDLDRRVLTRAAAAQHLSPKAMDVLALLIERRPRVVSKQELFDAIWPGAFVTDNVLATLVTDIRAATGDDARRPRFVRTVHGQGYVFDAAVAEDQPGVPSTPSTCVLLRDRQEIRLMDGDNILGRMGDGVLVIESRSVSKRHARVTVGAGEVTIEDLGSKNGTWIGDEPVTARHPIRDGDMIRLGRVVLTVRIGGVAASTTTSTGAREPTKN